jgi:hypothetical protein
MYKFNENKYSKWYFRIINKAQDRIEVDGYTEKHHIIPKSLGGANNKTNIVKLTGREHFVVHLLLIRMVKPEDVYRMVHAIIRFTTKVNNSKEYELLRAYVSKFSQGKYNCSYGKVWAYHKETKEIIYIPLKQFDATTHTRGLPEQRGGFKNYMWITNGKEESLIPKNSAIPQGWKNGRLFVHDNEHMKEMAQKRHTPEKDAEHSKKLLGRVQIFNQETQKSKRIHSNELTKYLQMGWIKKSVPNASSKSTLILGKNYATYNEASRALGVTPQTIVYRVKSLSDKWVDWQYN